MDPERWRKIERIFHAVAEAGEDRRAAVLEQSCAGDESLRREVESLLHHHQHGGSFIEHPAFGSPGDLPADPGPSLVGAQVAQYKVLAEIGAGGMGVVYQAEDTRLGRVVALKFLPDDVSGNPAALERFRREARAASALNHPNICTIYDIAEHGGRHFIAMEYLDGLTLRDRVAGRALSTDEIARLAVPIAEALSAAHSKGVVHRDIKPANIIVTASRLVKVLDFGLAKLLRSEAETMPAESLTGTHAVTGTLPYMSPEQLRGREVDARTDIYALGVVLYEMATGRRPFMAELMPQVIDDILNSPPPPPRELNSQIPVKLEEIILKCLEKDPEDRYQTAKEIAVDIRRMAPPSSASQRLVSARPRPSPRMRLLLIASAILAVLLAASWVILRPRFFPPVRSIAVLPFVDESNDASSAYLTAGITEGVIDKLAEIPALRVMSRNSVFRFKGNDTDAQVAGQKLNVETVLTGRVVRQADALAISAELVNVRDGTQIWGRQLRYPISEISRAQDEMASAIAEKLRLRVNTEEKTRLAKPPTSSAEAYQLYLQARYHWNQRTPPAILKSIDLFQQAIEKDPNFALAYAGLADAYNFSHVFGLIPARECAPEAKAAATRALMLDPLLAEAHAALGLVKSHYDYDFAGAQRELVKAIELNPNYANGHLFYAGAYLTPMGRHAEAIGEMKKALELDPLSLPLNNLMGNTYLWAGDYEKALEQFRRTLELDPAFPLTHLSYAGALEASGNYEQDIAELQKGSLLSGSKPEQAAAWAEQLRQALHTGGPKAYWQKRLELRLRAPMRPGTGALGLAAAYALAGDKDKAFEWLEKSYEERDANLTLVHREPDFRSLRGDPRLSALLRRLGLPES